jgi:hypothetical protein
MLPPSRSFLLQDNMPRVITGLAGAHQLPSVEPREGQGQTTKAGTSLQTSEFFLDEEKEHNQK